MGNSPSIYGGGNANPGGPGGTRRKISTGGGGGGRKRSCCSMVEAGRSARRGKYRLAVRYTRMSVRLIMARLQIAGRSV